MGKKNIILLCGLACVLLIGQAFSVAFAEKHKGPEDFMISEYFSFYGSEGIDWRALQDSENNPILNACLRGATEKDLKTLGKAKLQERLASLEHGGLIKKTQDRYTLAFPAIVGPKREQLQRYVKQIVAKLLPMEEEMIAEIRPHLVGREEMLYHVLWSMIMDGPLAWNTAWAEMKEQIKMGDTSIQNKAWLVYPSHPFRVGTNTYGSGTLRITWSRNTPSPHVILKLMSEYKSELGEAIKQRLPVQGRDAREALSKYGLVDGAGRLQIYILDLEKNSEAAQAYAALGKEFGRKIVAHLDVTKIADMLEVAPGVALVIAYHEVCWELLQNLAAKKILEVPPIIAKAGTDKRQSYQLVSVVTGSRQIYPFLQTEKNEQEIATIKRFNAIRKRILAGEKYFNQSTPVDGLLTYMSAITSEDAEAYKKSIAMKFGGPISFRASWKKRCRSICIYRVPPWPENPSEGGVHPIYIMDKEFDDVRVYVYHEGRWIQLFNQGNPETDWRESVDRMKKMLLK